MRSMIPPFVQLICQTLREAGFLAYPVGGAVRDLLLSKTPHDWDVSTSATVEEMEWALRSFRLVPTGARHGTLSVISQERECVEVTTFRHDGDYLDGRRPEQVRFTKSLEEDLARRDFTINALCLAPDGHVIDLFSGMDDLQQKQIRAIGDPCKRFSEDALRILRALRFASQLGFSIEEKTADAMQQMKARIQLLSAERIYSELSKLLCGDHVVEVLLAYPQILFEAIPILRTQPGVYQRNDYHCYDVWEHTVRSVGFVEPRLELRLAMLLHDTGKPECSDGRGHFKGHASAGAKRAAEVLCDLKVPKATRDYVTKLVRLHAITIPNDSAKLKRMLAKYGVQMLLDLVSVCRADNNAKRPDIAKARSDYFDEILAKIDVILAERPVLTMRDMALDGNDLLDFGASKGPRIGSVLKSIFSDVLDGNLENEHSLLVSVAKERYFSKISDSF